MAHAAPGIIGDTPDDICGFTPPPLRRSREPPRWARRCRAPRGPGRARTSPVLVRMAQRRRGGARADPGELCRVGDRMGTHPGLSRDGHEPGRYGERRLGARFGARGCHRRVTRPRRHHRPEEAETHASGCDRPSHDLPGRRTCGVQGSCVAEKRAEDSRDRGDTHREAEAGRPRLGPFHGFRGHRANDQGSRKRSTRLILGTRKSLPVVAWATPITGNGATLGQIHPAHSGNPTPERRLPMKCA